MSSDWIKLEMAKRLLPPPPQCGPFLKSLLQCCFCFIFWFFGPKVYGILAPWPWNQTSTPCIGRPSPNYWTTRGVPYPFSVGGRRQAGQTVDWEKTVSWATGVGKTGSAHRRMKRNPYLTLHNSKWMYTLKLRHKTIKLLEENMGKNFMILDLAKLSWMLHKKHRQQKQK